MYFDGKYYYDMTLPQGLASSCQIFEAFATAIQWILEQRIPGIQCVHYLDDFLIIAESKEKCQAHLNALLSLFTELGVPIAHDKTTEPSQQIVFLGIELDTQQFCARLPKDKLRDYSVIIQSQLKESKIRKRDLDSLIGN